MSHPAERFDAPRSIGKGSPLKFLINQSLVVLIAESFAGVWQEFDQEFFISRANDGLDELELSGRGRHIAKSLHCCMPTEFKDALPIFHSALGPPIENADEIGLKPFFYFPHSHYITLSAVDAIDAGLDACYHLTSRFTAEFCIRPLINKDSEKVISRLRYWANDPDCHVRRLVSEGTRTRLPWAPHLPTFINNPKPVLELLELLKSDPSLYVRRSVANNLGDIGKDHPDAVLTKCNEWLELSYELNETKGEELRWIIRHALRYPDKKGDPKARELRVKAGLRARKCSL